MATALSRDAAATAPATSAPPPSSAGQTNAPTSQNDHDQTIYACTLHGLIPNPAPSAASTADPNAPTLSNLLGVLASLTPRHSAHLDDYSQHAMISQYTLYQSASLASNSQPPPNSDRPLHNRLTALAALLHSSRTEARIFCHYERVYTATSPAAAAQPQLPLRLTRPAIPPLPTTPFVLTSYSRPLPPARHSTHVRAVRSVPLYHITKVNSAIPPSAMTTAGGGPAAMDECDAVMELLAYRFDYELVKEGYVWLLDGDVTVSVWRLCRLAGGLHDLSSVEVVRGMQWVVEVSAQAIETQLSAVEERVVSVAKSLQPLVKCSKVVPET